MRRRIEEFETMQHPWEAATSCALPRGVFPPGCRSLGVSSSCCTMYTQSAARRVMSYRALQVVPRNPTHLTREWREVWWYKLDVTSQTGIIICPQILHPRQMLLFQTSSSIHLLVFGPTHQFPTGFQPQTQSQLENYTLSILFLVIPKPCGNLRLNGLGLQNVKVFKAIAKRRFRSTDALSIHVSRFLRGSTGPAISLVTNHLRPWPRLI